MIHFTDQGRLNAGSSSARFKQYAKKLPAQSVANLSGSPNPSQIEQPVTMTATVSSKFGTIPDGELVTFFDGPTAIAEVPLTAGVATFKTSSLSAGKHFLKATYAGDDVFKKSSSHYWQVVHQK